MEKKLISGEKWNIYWMEYSANTYLYGSTIRYIAKDHVEYYNELMPPGTVIKEWFSKVNYQEKRIEPELPMIDGETDYRISINISGPDIESCIVRLVFYDRYEQEAGSLILTEKEQDFKCPLKTYSYSIQLINGGMDRFVFHSITISELISETEGDSINVNG